MLQIFALIGQVLQIFAFMLQIFALIGQVLQIFALYQNLHSCGLLKNSNLNLNLISNLINFGFLNQIETKTKLDKCRLYEYRAVSYTHLTLPTKVRV